MSQERRAIYRVIPHGRDRLELVLCSDSSRPVATEIVDITIEGAGTRFEKLGAPDLTVGENVKLCISAPDIPSGVEVGATVAASGEAADYRSYSFKFDDREELERELPEEVYRVFNRRGAYRAAAFDAGPGVEIGIRAREPDASSAAAAGELRNISATGLAAIVPAADADALVDVRSVELTFSLPGNSRTLRISAWVRNRERLDDRVYFGLMFDARATRDYLDQEEEIVDFVLLRFQEKLARTVH